jgi:hypothetical protein
MVHSQVQWLMQLQGLAANLMKYHMVQKAEGGVISYQLALQ